MTGTPFGKLFKKFSLFVGAGLVGFFTDAFVFFCLFWGGGFGHVFSRISASGVAMAVTWALNRSFAFKAGRADSIKIEAGKYILASILGGLSNLIVLSIIIRYDDIFYHIPSYVMGAITGLIVNYILYNNFVFYDKRRARVLRR